MTGSKQLSAGLQWQIIKLPGNTAWVQAWVYRFPGPQPKLGKPYQKGKLKFLKAEDGFVKFLKSPVSPGGWEDQPPSIRFFRQYSQWTLTRLVSTSVAHHIHFSFPITPPQEM